jgi:diaminopimelate decarboxylase
LEPGEVVVAAAGYLRVGRVETVVQSGARQVQA